MQTTDQEFLSIPYNPEPQIKGGFKLYPRDLFDIERIIIKAFEEIEIHIKFGIRVEFNFGRKVETFGSVDEFINHHLYGQELVNSLQIFARANQETNPRKELSISDCIVSYGSQKNNLSAEGDNNKINVKVTGSGKETVELSNLLAARLKNTVFKNAITTASQLISKYLIAVLLVGALVFIPTFFSSALEIHGFSNAEVNLDSLKDELKSLQEDSYSLETVEEKVDFLYQERILEIQIESLDDQRRKLEFTFNPGATLRILIFFFLFLLSVFSISAQFPDENFMWGKYEKKYQNIENSRNAILGAVVLSAAINIITSVF
jgi:hypothetical protein